MGKEHLPNLFCGIYKITNVINGKSYIGQSHNIAQRWKIHLRLFTKTENSEYNKALYRAMRKYGIENFTFSIVELCNVNQLNKKEKYWIKKYNSYRKGYNENIGGDNIRNNQGENHPRHKLSLEDVKAIRTRYNNLERRCIVYKDYQDRISFSGFAKIWKGQTWTNIMMNVYSKKNITYHKYNTGKIK